MHSSGRRTEFLSRITHATTFRWSNVECRGVTCGIFRGGGQVTIGQGLRDLLRPRRYAHAVFPYFNFCLKLLVFILFTDE